MQIQDDYQVKRIGNEVKSWDISEDRVSCPASVLLQPFSGPHTTI